MKIRFGRTPVIVIAAIAVLLLIGTGCREQSAGAADQALQIAETAPEALPRRSFTIVAVGDIMLDRNVWRAIRNSGYESILAKVRDLTRSADIAFANLECPLSDEGPHSPSKYLLFRAPPETAQVLVDGGFDIVSLANNHTLNAGKKGVENTLDTLEKYGVAYCGCRHPDEKEDAWQPTYFAVNDYVLGFMAYTDLSFEHGSYAKIEDYDELARQLASAKAECNLLFVSVHWGDEYHKTPSDRQRKLAHYLVDNGADVVLGHHPHMLQGVEVYNGCPILYSMGNFVFDQREGERMESAIFHLKYTENYGWNIFAKPIWIPRSRMGPVYPEAARAHKIAARLAELSADLGTEASEKNSKVWINIRRPRENREAKTDQITPTEEQNNEPL